MSYRDIQHPDITRLENYGVPYDDDEAGEYCDHCGCSLEDKDIFSDRYHHALCEDCLKNLHIERWA